MGGRRFIGKIVGPNLSSAYQGARRTGWYIGGQGSDALFAERGGSPYDH